MKVHAFSDFDLDIARTRIILSLLAMLSLYVDPTTGRRPVSSDHVRAGDAALSPRIQCRDLFSASIRGCQAMAADSHDAARSFFAMAIAYLTEGQTGPSYVFFVFAIIAVWVRARCARSCMSRCWEWCSTWR